LTVPLFPFPDESAATVRSFIQTPVTDIIRRRCQSVCREDGGVDAGVNFLSAHRLMTMYGNQVGPILNEGGLAGLIHGQQDV